MLQLIMYVMLTALPSHGEGWAVQRGEVGLASGVRRAVVYSGAGMYMSRANWVSHGVPNGITDGTEACKQLVFLKHNAEINCYQTSNK